MHSEITICNMALQYLGIRGITSYTEHSREAQLLSSIYPMARNELLECFDFSFSRAIERLARKEEVPPKNAFYIYQIPLYCLRIREVCSTTEYYITNERTIQTKSPELTIEMTRIITDTTQFPAMFTEALQCRIGSMVAVALTGNTTLAKELYTRYTSAFEEAVRIDSAKYIVPKEELSSWILIRNTI